MRRAGLYNVFLAPGSPCELQIDNALQKNLVSQMTIDMSGNESVTILIEIVNLFGLAQVSVFKLMSSVSF
jgi:hypothetical protein